MSDHTLWLEVEEGRENRAYTHSRDTSVGRSSVIGDGKSELSLVSCSGKLYIQLYPSSPSTVVMLLQLLDVTAGLTLAPAPVVATVRQVSRSAPVPAAAIVHQQGALFGTAFNCCAFTQGIQKII